MQIHIFNNNIPVTFREDGFLNATAIAGYFGKQPRDYLKTEQTQEYITALAEFLSTKKKILVEENQLVSVINGGNNRGTWLHPKLAVHFARWLDARFAVWCDMKIEEIISGGSKLSPAQKQRIQKEVNRRHHRTGEHWQEIYRKLHDFCQVNSYHEIPAADFESALTYLIEDQDAEQREALPPTPRQLFELLAKMTLFAEKYYELQRVMCGSDPKALEQLDKVYTGWLNSHLSEEKSGFLLCFRSELKDDIQLAYTFLRQQSALLA